MIILCGSSHELAAPSTKMAEWGAGRRPQHALQNTQLTITDPIEADLSHMTRGNARRLAVTYSYVRTSQSNFSLQGKNFQTVLCVTHVLCGIKETALHVLEVRIEHRA